MSLMPASQNTVCKLACCSNQNPGGCNKQFLACFTEIGMWEAAKQIGSLRPSDCDTYFSSTLTPMPATPHHIKRFMSDRGGAGRTSQPARRMAASAR